MAHIVLNVFSVAGVRDNSTLSTEVCALEALRCVTTEIEVPGATESFESRFGIHGVLNFLRKHSIHFVGAIMLLLNFSRLFIVKGT